MAHFSGPKVDWYARAPSTAYSFVQVPTPERRSRTRGGAAGWFGSKLWSRMLRWLWSGRTHATNNLSVPFLQTDETYCPPEWAKDRLVGVVPQQRLGLGILPTPVHRWLLPGLPPGVEVWIKRDDLTGMQLSGNKVRKLEFLLADAKRQGCDCVITIGGIQSNHCRATAVAARYLGLETHLILRTSRQLVDADPGLVGNLLVDRMVGSHIHLVTKEDYCRYGSVALGAELVAQLRAQGKKPYLIPVGGSNALGTWGYLQAVEEIRQQCSALKLTDLVMACGSGGTTAGLALGVFLSGLNLRVHAYGVCDTPDYFYDYVDGLLDDLGASPKVLRAGRAARGLFRAVQARGAGYAISTQAELNTVKAVSEATGVVLDPVYSGKAVHALLMEINEQPQAWTNRRVLFVHTGGLLGMYDKIDQLQELYTPSPAEQPSLQQQASLSSQGSGLPSPSGLLTSKSGGPTTTGTAGIGVDVGAGMSAAELLAARAVYGSRVQRLVMRQ